MNSTNHHSQHSQSTPERQSRTSLTCHDPWPPGFLSRSQRNAEGSQATHSRTRSPDEDDALSGSCIQFSTTCFMFDSLVYLRIHAKTPLNGLLGTVAWESTNINKKCWWMVANNDLHISTYPVQQYSMCYHISNLPSMSTAQQLVISCVISSTKLLPKNIPSSSIY